MIGAQGRFGHPAGQQGVTGFAPPGAADRPAVR